ncbi:MAG: hypothetical protein FJX67_10810 [Alphaproteobacteria bacterium]|nr:hypothetical protein [Alphaproteobacteria bacterium]
MTSIAFAPLFDWIVIAVLAALAALLLGFGALRRARGLAWRFASLAILLLALANPVLIEEERRAVADVVAVVVDESPSQAVGRRPAQTQAALAELRARLGAMENLELRVIAAGAPAATAGGPVDGTHLFETIGRALSDVPRKRMAGVVMLTDGQVHDTPKADDPPPFGGPLHVLVTGARGERDRRIVLEQATSYGLVGKTVEVRIRVDDPAAAGTRVNLTLTRASGTVETIPVTVGETATINVHIDHAGANIFQFEVAAAPNELTVVNNRAVVTVNGVRERLRVLLVSGEPHPGERVWRNILKADPSVDLVHFTILRPPEKQDATPVRELSLIAFPIRELFEVKLNEFDLIIFDRYRRRGVLPTTYYDNIARYVDRGGAVLESSGPEFASPVSLFRTPLGEVLPAAPTGSVIEQPLKPGLTDQGRRHPITADLPGADTTNPPWGRWFRQIEVNVRRGVPLMQGSEARPLLVVDRVGEGRVAQVLSDHLWLWARGFEGGGPHSEILRRLAHWLMKEPDLEESDLRAQGEGNGLAIVRRSLEPDASPVEVTAPSGEVQQVRLEEGFGGRARASVPVKEMGIYKVSDGARSRLAAVGNLNPREYANMRATADVLGPLATATGGTVHWLADGLPEPRRVREGRRAGGRDWIGLLANNDYRVDSVREVTLLPGLALLLIGLGTLVFAWRQEGR